MCGRKVFWTLCAGMIMLNSCQQEMVQDIMPQDDSPQALIKKTFTASFVNTKTYRDDNQQNGFSQGDIIRYFGNVSTDIRSTIVADTGESISLELFLSPDDTEVTAVYGGMGLENQSDNSFQVLVSEDKIHIGDGSFSSSQVAVSHTDANESRLFFYNVTSLVKFTLERDDVRKAVMFSNDGSIINSRSLSVYYNNGVPEADQYNEDAVSFAPLSIKGSGTYYIPMMPQKISGGFTIEFYDGDDEFIGTARSNKSLDIGTNEIINLGVLDKRISKTEMLYQIADWENDRYYYSLTNGSVMAIQRNHDTDTKFAYSTTVYNKNLGPDYSILVHSDSDGVVHAIETLQANYELTYSDSGDSFVVEKTYINGDGKIQKDKFDPIPNPNYNRDKLPPDYSMYEGLSPHQVLTWYAILSPIANCLSAIAGKSWFGASALVASLGNATSPLGTPTLSKAVALTSFAVAIGTILLAGASGGIGIAAVAMFVSIADVFNASMLEKQDEMVNILYGNAVPVTLGYEVLSETSVRLSCAVSEWAPARVGIILADGILVNKHNCIQKKSVEIQQDQTEYSVTFSGLIPGKKYKYRAYLTDDDASYIDYCKYASEIKEFYLYKGADDLGLSAVWATCNLGAAAPWEKGILFSSLSDAKEVAENITGWRLPTRAECEELVGKLYYTQFHFVNGWQYKDNESLFFPLTQDSYGLYMTSSGHPNYGQSFSYVWYLTTQGIGVNWMATPVAIRLVKE